MKVGVVGSREFNDYELMNEVLSKLDIEIIISGGARGADFLAEKYAKKNNIDLKVFPAEWEKYGKSAGFKRNHLIVNASDMIVAFRVNKSRGTTHTIEVAKFKKKEVKIIDIKSV